MASRNACQNWLSCAMHSLVFRGASQECDYDLEVVNTDTIVRIQELCTKNAGTLLKSFILHTTLGLVSSDIWFGYR